MASHAYLSTCISNIIMSVLPSSAVYLASATRNGGNDHDCELFHNFFEHWLAEQNQFLQQLVQASERYKKFTNNPQQQQLTENSHMDILNSLVNLVLDHYENYYRTKSRWIGYDVLSMLTPCWRSTLEDAFLWIGGWRPSMAFHLLYSKSGLQLEAQLHELIRGLGNDDLGDLSPSQLSRVDELHRNTIKEEKDLSEKMAKIQEKVADSSMVELSNVVSEMMRQEETVNGVEIEDERVEATLAEKQQALEEVFHKADDLRLRTLKRVVGILSPIQAVYFLIAAAELHLRLHEWGKNRGGRNGTTPHRQHEP